VIRDRAAEILSPHVDQRNNATKERSEEHDDVAGSPATEHQGAVQPEDEDGERGGVPETSRFVHKEDVARPGCGRGWGGTSPAAIPAGPR